MKRLEMNDEAREVAALVLMLTHATTRAVQKYRPDDWREAIREALPREFEEFTIEDHLAALDRLNSFLE